MTRSAMLEASGILTRLVAALRDASPGQQGRAGSDLRRAAGALIAGAEKAILSGTLGADLLAIFQLATAAGVEFFPMDRIRQKLLTENPAGLPAIAVTQAGVRFALSQMELRLAKMDYVSRDDVDRFLTITNTAFAQAEEAASDQADAVSYRSILALHAAVTRDLTERGRPLPRMVSYSFPRSMPALWLANRIYGDGGEAAQLVAENRPVHPAFMSPTGRALSTHTDH